jgi:hypothetical protein
MIGIQLIYIIAGFFWFQQDPPLKPTSQFDIITNYQLKTKPTSDNPKIVFEREVETKETGTDLLPYLAIQIKVKYWKPDVEQIKVVDGLNKTHLKKKVNDSGVYDLDLGYVDDMKDGVTSGTFNINFMERKKIIETITLTVEPDGTFKVNGEKRGKF